MRIIAQVVLVAVLTSQVACGTLMYPERRGQRTTGQIDSSVLLMDGLWMLFFLVPGLVALGVDFATGAIYLPDGKRASLEADDPALTVWPGSDLTIRTSARGKTTATWHLDLRDADASLVGSWTLRDEPELTIAFPASIGGGAYELQVTRNGVPLGRVPVEVRD